MKKTVLALSAAAVCVASAAPVLAEGQNPMTAPVQISMQGEASMTVANDEAVILFSAESRRPDAVSASNDAAKRGNAAIEALKRFSDKIDVGTTGLSTNPVYTRAFRTPVPRKARFPRSEPGRPARPCALRCVT
mgnify:CR=1 FL=1